MSRLVDTKGLRMPEQGVRSILLNFFLTINVICACFHVRFIESLCCSKHEAFVSAVVSLARSSCRPLVDRGLLPTE